MVVMVEVILPELSESVLAVLQMKVSSETELIFSRFRSIFIQFQNTGLWSFQNTNIDSLILCLLGK